MPQESLLIGREICFERQIPQEILLTLEISDYLIKLIDPDLAYLTERESCQ